MKSRILKLLKETDGYISGQELCQSFQVSRTAVWKMINQLKEEGYEISAVRNRGYRLVSAADVITATEITSHLTGLWAGYQIKYYETVDSTNTRAKELAEKGSEHGTLVVAEQQLQGKGRRGRSWVSSQRTGIFMSLVLRPSISPVSASMLTLVAALAVSEGIQIETGLTAQIKWPNDIVINRKKVCGILTEMSSEMDLIHYVVTGIGINVNLTDFPEEISDKATSLRMESGQAVNRSRLIAVVMASFEHYYDAFLKNENLLGLLEEYNGKLAGYGQLVTVQGKDGQWNGTALGIDEMGELMVKTETGKIRNVVSGEVSVRGLYSYI